MYRQKIIVLKKRKKERGGSSFRFFPFRSEKGKESIISRPIERRKGGKKKGRRGRLVRNIRDGEGGSGETPTALYAARIQGKERGEIQDIFLLFPGEKKERGEEKIRCFLLRPTPCPARDPTSPEKEGMGEMEKGPPGSGSA